MWDVAVEDYSSPSAYQSSEDIVELTVAGTQSGSIILLHPWHGRTATQSAIRPIIQELKSQNYRFVTIDELLALR